MHNDHSEITLDLSGLLCPLPVLKARKQLNQMPSGARLIIMATDPMASVDIPHFCVEQGHVLEDKMQNGKTLTFRIRKK